MAEVLSTSGATVEDSQRQLRDDYLAAWRIGLQAVANTANGPEVVAMLKQDCYPAEQLQQLTASQLGHPGV